ncbi:MAG TPA: hypothetical protein VFB75_01300 [Burkholderiales bacterium]|nr:hypothetical protein [Burkholderiales bacterium]
MMRPLTLLLLAAVLVVGVAPAGAQERKLPLVDEAAGDVSWLRFKKQLVGAIQKRDKQFLLSILDRNVRNQDDRSRGIAHFRKQWELDTDDSPVWRELAAALQLGGAYIKRENRPRELCAPYVLGRWPEDVEPFKHGVVISRDAQVQAEPSNSAAALGALSYDIVVVSDWEVDDKAPEVKQKWVKIRYRNRDGYIPEEQIRSPIEQAACFVKSANGWRMTAFAPAGGE